MTAGNVSQVLNLWLQESAFGRFELEGGTHEWFEYLPQLIDVGREVWGDYDDVIEAYQQCLPMEFTKDLFYEPLERSRSRNQPKGEHLSLPQSVLVMNPAFSWVSGMRGTCQ